MVLFLLKRDDVLKVALVCSFLAPLVLVPGPDQVSGTSFLFSLGFVALLGGARLRLDRRSSHFNAGLPITGRQLYLVRALASLAAVWLPIAVACLLILALRRHTGGTQVMALLQGGGVLTLAALLPLSVRLQEAAISGQIAAGLWIGTVFGGLALCAVLPPLWHVACFVVAAGALLLRSCYSAPPSFQLAPAEPVRERSTGGRESLRPAWWTMLRSAKPWLGIILLILGVATGGSIQLTLPFLLFVFQLGIFARNGIRWLQPFPLSPRSMLVLTLATTAAPFMVGSLLGMAFVPANEGFLRMQPFVGVGPPYLDDRHFSSRTNIPLEFWRLAPGGKAPIVRAPWGESVQPGTLPILGLAFYNPYDSSQANSDRFVEWQFENATQVLYGRRIPESEYYGPKRPVLPGKTNENILMLGLTLAGLLAGVSLRELALCHSLTRSTAFAVKLFPIPLIPYFLATGVDQYYYGHEGTQVIAPFCHVLLSRLSTVLPQNLMAVALVAFTPSLFLYFLIEWQFAQSETTGALIPRMVGGMEPE